MIIASITIAIHPHLTILSFAIIYFFKINKLLQLQPLHNLNKFYIILSLLYHTFHLLYHRLFCQHNLSKKNTPLMLE